jgi:hypothetical protein
MLKTAIRGSRVLLLVTLFAGACSASQSGKRGTDEGGAGTGGSGGTGGGAGKADGGCTPATRTGVCDTYPVVCGCTGTQNCVFDDGTGQTKCLASGSKTPDSACTSETCAAGYACYDGTCRRYCETDTDCSGVPFRKCAQAYNSSDQAVTGFKVCDQHCDPRDPANADRNPSFGPCGAGATCVWWDYNDVGDRPICYPLNTTPPANCEYDEDCPRGQGCSSSNGGTCKRWCRVTKAGDCTGATPSCWPIDPPLHVDTDLGKIEYGFCNPRSDAGTN